MYMYVYMYIHVLYLYVMTILYTLYYVLMIQTHHCDSMHIIIVQLNGIKNGLYCNTEVVHVRTHKHKCADLTC